MSLYINSIIAKKSKVGYAIKIGLLYGKNIQTRMEPPHFKVPPLKKSKKINVPNSPLLYKPTPQRFRWLRRITLRKRTHIPTHLNMPYCCTDLQRVQGNTNNYTVIQMKN